MQDVLPIRPAAVAGLFYPASPVELRAAVQDFLAAAPRWAGPGAEAPKAPKAIIAPHAGYRYSGPIAASAFQALSPDPPHPEIRRVVVIGPAHHVGFRGIALPGASGFSTPLGVVPVDAEAVAAMADLPQVTTRPDVHAPEHSLEVELPFLQSLWSDFTLLPLVVGEASGEEVAEVLERVWGGDETRIVVSSDLSHYLSYGEARRMDAATAGKILRLQGPLESWQACGARPIHGLLLAARRRGLRAVQLDLRNSGDTAGDRRQVVGYGAFAFSAFSE
jgi:AmmeMemoRadiSam system protein B